MSIFRNTPPVVTRMAPSPTGHLHIGTARTALFNYLYAKRHKGVFIMRIEDTDKERSRPEYETEILEGLSWLGLSWDSLYRQSDRNALYRSYLEKIVSSGHAYVSKEESKTREGEYVEVVRLRNPNSVVTFTDEIRGDISFDTTELGDFVIARSLDDALYHFTVVVDDHEMGVTHVIRGEDHISNTPRQILIQQAVGAIRPTYAHLPLILAPDRSKLSKRHGAVMLNEYAQQGFLRESLINYLALLGWNPGTDVEVFRMEELEQIFDLSGVQKNGAVFNIEKLRWFNKSYLSHMSDEDFFSYISQAIPQDVFTLPQYSADRLTKLIPLIRERSSTRLDVAHDFAHGEYDFAFQAPIHDPNLIMWKNDTHPRVTLSRLQKLAECVAQIPENSSPDEVKSYIWDYALEAGKGEVLWPLRTTLTGKERSPDPFTVIHILGSAESYKRIITACDTILRTS